MERSTVLLDDELVREFDRPVATRGYGSRSEAVRDVLRSHLARLRKVEIAEGPCVADLSCAYSHHELELSERLAAHQHGHHNLTIA